MDHAARGPLLAIATLTTAGALAMAPITVAPNDIHAPSLSPARVSTQAVQLTDAWSDLAVNTVVNVLSLAGTFLGTDSNFPLPNPTIPLAPIATQLVLNQLVYIGQLLTGQGGQIPNEIITHLGNIQQVGVGLSNDLPGLIVDQLETPFKAFQVTADYISSSNNLLLALIEAPAVFLDGVLNSQYGILGFNGPIALPIVIRNVLAKAIETPIPDVVLPFKKPAAASTSEPAVATTATTAPSGIASSARSKSTAPIVGSRKAATTKANKTPSAKTTTKGGAGAGQAHSKRD